jgi:Domain of unknown function (DUF1707)/2TM domain
MRTSEAEREAVVEDLRRHASAGRLDLEELEQRVEAALGARTAADLAALRDDLPELPVSDFTEHLRVFVAVNALLVAIWALTGAGYFWPVWPFMGWGIAVVLHGVCDPGREREWASGSRSRPRRRATAS